MAGTIATEPQVLHAVPGRARVHVPALAEHGARSVEAQVRRVPGVRDVEANPLTGNVLVRFDPHATTARAILDALRTPGSWPEGSEPRCQRVEDTRAVREEAQTSPAMHSRAPRVLSSGRSHMKRARIAVRGLDRDPDLSRRVVERLERYPSVRTHANPLTGRVLVEFDAHRTDIDDMLAAIAAVELPALPGEDTPSHPLDPAPLIQSAARTVARPWASASSPCGRWPGFRSSRPARRRPPASSTPCRAFPSCATGCARCWAATGPTCS